MPLPLQACRRMKYMVSAWKESKELDVRAIPFQLISIFNWKADCRHRRPGRAEVGLVSMRRGSKRRGRFSALNPGPVSCTPRHGRTGTAVSARAISCGACARGRHYQFRCELLFLLGSNCSAFATLQARAFNVRFRGIPDFDDGDDRRHCRLSVSR